VIRLALRVPAAHAELVLAELLELAPAGVEEVELPGADGAPDLVEYAIYGPPGELPALPDLRAAVGGVPVEVSGREVPDDWAERWRRFHRPLLLAAPDRPDGAAPVPSLHVRPPWLEPCAQRPVEEIVIDPGQAFGTGAHATTRLCLELLLELAAQDPSRGAVLDVGAGSGVLAIAAARLGYGPVLALDNDPESVAAAGANARVNGVQMEVRRFDLRREAVPWPDGPAVVLANLLRPLLLELAGSFAGAPGRPAHLIAGGLLREEADEVARAFAGRAGLRERERRELGEWAALWLAAPATGSATAPLCPP